MKIIKEGDLRNLHKPFIFECKTCGCIFEADDTEYKHDYSQRENCGWYEVICPTCGKWVTVDDKDIYNGEQK